MLNAAVMRARVVRLGPLAIAVAVIAWWCVSAVRAKTGGEPSLPLDDAFIHLQYARAFATGHPLHYVPGDPATSGATSLLWSAMLAPFWAVGARGLNLVWVAWGLSFAALAGLAWETRRLAARLLPRGSAVLAGAFALSFGGHVWCAGSGMEVIPFAWLLVRAARLCAEVWENETGGEPLPPLKSWDGLIDGAIDPPTMVSTKRLATELAIVGACLPLLRPEGALVAVLLQPSVGNCSSQSAVIRRFADAVSVFTASLDLQAGRFAYSGSMSIVAPPASSSEPSVTRRRVHPSSPRVQSSSSRRSWETIRYSRSASICR